MLEGVAGGGVIAGLQLQVCEHEGVGEGGVAKCGEASRGFEGVRQAALGGSDGGGAEEMLARRGAGEAGVGVAIRPADHVEQKIHWTPIQARRLTANGAARSRPHRRWRVRSFFFAASSSPGRGVFISGDIFNIG